jgi:nicotinamidase-related amidase
LDGSCRAWHRRLVAHDAARTVFTRFITPVSADDRAGRWQRYFARWNCATQPRLPPGALDIVSPLARFIPPATVIDKPGYSAFFASTLQSFLAEKNINTLIISGSETDVCVLATVLDAVDRGFRVIVVEDGLLQLIQSGARCLDDALSDALHRSDRVAHARCGPRTLAGSSVTASGTFAKGRP